MSELNGPNGRGTCSGKNPCKSVVWKIGPFVDGELPPTEREAVEAHLRSCTDCVEMAMELRALDDHAARDKVPLVSGEEWARLWEGIRSRSETSGVDRAVVLARSLRMRKWLMPALAAAAMLVAGVFAGWNILHRQRGGQEIGSEHATPPSKVEDSAELLSGHKPGIRVDDDVITIDYSRF